MPDKKCKIASCGDIVELWVVKQLKRKKTNMKWSKIIRGEKKSEKLKSATLRIIIFQRVIGSDPSQLD